MLRTEANWESHSIFFQQRGPQKEKMESGNRLKFSQITRLSQLLLNGYGTVYDGRSPYFLRKLWLRLEILEYEDLGNVKLEHSHFLPERLTGQIIWYFRSVKRLCVDKVDPTNILFLCVFGNKLWYWSICIMFRNLFKQSSSFTW